MSDDKKAVPLLNSSLASLKEALNAAKEEGVKQDGLRLIEEAIESTQKAYDKLMNDIARAFTVLDHDISTPSPLKFKRK